MRWRLQLHGIRHSRQAAVVAQGYCEWRRRLLRTAQQGKAGSAPKENGVFSLQARCWLPATEHIPGLTVLANVAGAPKVHANVSRLAWRRVILENLPVYRNFTLYAVVKGTNDSFITHRLHREFSCIRRNFGPIRNNRGPQHPVWASPRSTAISRRYWKTAISAW